MKKIIFSGVLILFTFVMYAKGTWTLQGETYEVDTLYHAKVGPGTTQTSLKVSGNLDLRIFYTTTDLTDPNVEIRVAKAKDKILAVATVPAMAKSNTKEGEIYFAGVNADFFDTSNGQPLGTNVLNSELYNSTTNSNWMELSFDKNKTPCLGKLSFSGSVTKADGTSYEVSTINSGRLENCLVIFSEKFGSSTGTNQWGIEVVVKPVETGATIALGKSVKMKIVGSPATTGNMTIPSGAYVLSGHGYAKTFLETLADGDEIEVSLTATNVNGEPVNPVWAVGGCPMLLKDGVVQETENAAIISHLPNKEPRTAIGYDSTGTKVVLLIVDGRSAVSDGCRTKILADIMRETGCSDAMNFDGGGSSTLYVKSLGTDGVVNVPSAGSLRAVTNGVYAVATVPTDTEITEIRFEDWQKKVAKYDYYTPKFYGYNKYGVLVDADLQGVTLSCSAELGTIDESGRELFANGSGSHMLTAAYKGMTAAIVVNVEGSDPYFLRSRVLLDSYNDYEAEVMTQSGESSIRLDNSIFTWSVDDTTIASVDAFGVVKGLKNGSTVLRFSVDGIEKSLPVEVEIPETHYRPFDLSHELSTWTIEHGTAVSSSTLSLYGEEGYAIDYTISESGSGTKVLNMLKDLRTWSRPDSVLVELNPCESSLKTLIVYYEDGQGEQKMSRKVLSKLPANTVTRVLFPMSTVAPTDDMSSFPITFKRLYLQVSDAAGSVCRVEIPRISMVYNAVPADKSGIEEISVKGENAVLLSPNPVKRGVTVHLNVAEPVSYTVCAISGTMLNQGYGTEISTSNLMPGMYIVTVNQPDGVKVAKLLVK